MVYITVSKSYGLRRGVFWTLEKMLFVVLLQCVHACLLKLVDPHLIYVNVLKIWKTRGSITQSSLMPPQSAAYKMTFKSYQRLSKTVRTF